MTRGVWVCLPDDTVEAISEQLEARGWAPEYVTDAEIKMTFPDPRTGIAMGYSEFWLSWRLVDGQITYGIADDIGDDWRRELEVTDAMAPGAVAEAADRVMHLLWHCDERDALRELHQKCSLLSALEFRMQELGRRLMVTPGMIRNALKPSESWTP
ncbi:hypothetical protein ACFRDV_22115 [Streptomyces fagopyri]|uniref:hypothetical protein n=1 Tax=Streptomyces fagopyri TaxID=2662397 RepID=UPI00368F69BA